MATPRMHPQGSSYTSPQCAGLRLYRPCLFGACLGGWVDGSAGAWPGSLSNGLRGTSFPRHPEPDPTGRRAPGRTAVLRDNSDCTRGLQDLRAAAAHRPQLPRPTGRCGLSWHGFRSGAPELQQPCAVLPDPEGAAGADDASSAQIWQAQADPPEPQGMPRRALWAGP